MAELTVDQWLAIRKEAALKIDPETAEVTFDYGQILDPYGVRHDLHEECDCVGRIYFARAPGSDVWVCFYDLPEEISERMWKLLRAGHYNRDPCEDLPF
jgi:hypothetical protein